MSTVATLATSAASTLAAIGWTPEIRNILGVAVGVIVLCGSVYLLVGSNVGTRTGLPGTMDKADGFLAYNLNTKVFPSSPACFVLEVVVRDPQQPQIARFQELKPAYPGTEVRIGDCP